MKDPKQNILPNFLMHSETAPAQAAGLSGGCLFYFWQCRVLFSRDDGLDFLLLDTLCSDYSFRNFVIYRFCFHLEYSFSGAQHIRVHT